MWIIRVFVGILYHGREDRGCLPALLGTFRAHYSQVSIDKYAINVGPTRNLSAKALLTLDMFLLDERLIA